MPRDKVIAKPLQSEAVEAPAVVPGISAVRRERGSGVFDTLREMAISYQLRPGERVSEIELAERLGVSRTPVREALTRLVTDGFLVTATRGYMRRPLDIQETLDQYEARVAVERECLRLALQRGTDEEIAEALAFLEESRSVPPNTPVRSLVELDEAFHMRLAAMARNGELRRMLGSLNERIRFIRWIDMENVGRDSTQYEHQMILDALRSRDAAAADHHLTEHISLRREQIVQAITQGLARIYLGDSAKAHTGADPGTDTA
jgi:DNA-binding GntR family transcriptional regulator